MLLSRVGWFLASCCLLATLSLACGDECQPGEARCDGNVLVDCPGIDAWRPTWAREGPCPEPNPVCAESGRRAACVASPRTECGSAEAPVCIDSTDFLQCDSIGYLEQGSCGPDFEPPCAWNDRDGWACMP